MTDGSNLINESMVRALMRKEAILERAKKQACDALNAQHKKIKTYGLKVKNFLAIYHQMTASDDGDEYIQDLQEQRRLAQMMKLPIGHQLDLIDSFDAMGKVNEEIGFRAYRDGARAHLDGKEEGDIAPQRPDIAARDFLSGGDDDGLADADFIITNPPWSWPTFSRIAAMAALWRKPAWFLLPADYAHNRRCADVMKRCERIVSIGRVKWIADSPASGKENCAWYLLQPHPVAVTAFFPRQHREAA